MKPDIFFVISAYKNDILWVHEYADDNYVVYDKSNTLPEDPHIIKIDDVGYNIYDNFLFIVDRYDNLPDLICFVQGHIWDHCCKETFDRIIWNREFTSIEDYSHVPESYAHKKDFDGGYLERNESWYLHMHDPKFSHRKYSSFDEFMREFFTDYQELQWVRFAPGAQYIVPKENILKYSKSFWERLMHIVDYAIYPTEAFLLERASFYIFSGKYEERK